MSEKRKEIFINLCKLPAKILNILTLAFLGSWLFMVFTACVITWVLLLTGCCGGENADLVVVNDSRRAVYSITVEYENSTESVMAANGTALLERGQTYGLTLEDGTKQVTVTLADRYNRELARTEVDFAGKRLYLTLEQNGSFSVGEE